MEIDTHGSPKKVNMLQHGQLFVFSMDGKPQIGFRALFGDTESCITLGPNADGATPRVLDYFLIQNQTALELTDTFLKPSRELRHFVPPGAPDGDGMLSLTEDKAYLHVDKGGQIVYIDLNSGRAQMEIDGDRVRFSGWRVVFQRGKAVEVLQFFGYPELS